MNEKDQNMDAIRVYLRRLSAAAFGMDTALVHDMLADAEEHLRNAVRDGVTPEAAVEAFGNAEDVVRAYQQTDATEKAQKVTPVGRDLDWSEGMGGGRVSKLAAIPLVGIWFDRRAWGSLLFCILGLIPALFYFVVLVTGISMGLGMSVTLVGLPLLVLMLGAARAMSLFHGQLIEWLTGVRMPRRYAPPPARAENSFWRRIKLWLTDGRSWLSAAFLVGNLPVAVLLFALFVSLGSLAASTLAVAFAGIFSPLHVNIDSTMEVNLWFWRLVPDANGRLIIPVAAGLWSLAVGLAVATLTLHLARCSGWLYAQAAKAIQVTRLDGAV